MIKVNTVLKGIGTILGSASGSFTKYIVFASILAIMGAGTYFYYEKSQNQIRILIDENAKKTIALELQDKRIKELELNDSIRESILKQVYEDLANARKQDEKPEIESPIVDPLTNEPVDLDSALKKDLGVTENFINKQYNDNGKCESLYSGVPVSELEKDKNEQDKLLKYCGLNGIAAH